MSNLSILERLEQSLEAYAEGGSTRAAFVDFLSGSIRALESVPLTVTHDLGRHEHAIEIEGYLFDEGFVSRQELAQENLLAWIHELKRLYAR